MSEQHSKPRTGGLETLMRHNPYTASAGLTPEVIDAAVRRAHVERARAATSLTTAIWRRLRTGLQAMARQIASAQRRRAAHLIRRNLDPYLRDDIGLGAGQARGLVDDLLTSPPAGSGVSDSTRAGAQAAPDSQHRRAA